MGLAGLGCSMAGSTRRSVRFGVVWDSRAATGRGEHVPENRRGKAVKVAWDAWVADLVCSEWLGKRGWAIWARAPAGGDALALR